MKCANALAHQKLNPLQRNSHLARLLHLELPALDLFIDLRGRGVHPLHPRHSVSDREGHQGDRREQHGPAPRVPRTARVRRVALGLHILHTEAHEGEVGEARDEGAELDPAPNDDVENAGEHAGEAPVGGHEIPEPGENRHDECDCEHVCHAEEVSQLHCEPRVALVHVVRGMNGKEHRRDIHDDHERLAQHRSLRCAELPPLDLR
mmetsp:Transcript_20288/g.50714  ORF Transcript_20288/g.50714 Transcript_20288/m.50714 type:complete len:206 (-) Transcript_20288:1216-1833(-)